MCRSVVQMDVLVAVQALYSLRFWVFGVDASKIAAKKISRPKIPTQHIQNNRRGLTMRLLPYFLVVAILLNCPVTLIDAQCSICPNGVDSGLLDVDPNGEGVTTCASIDSLLV